MPEQTDSNAVFLARFPSPGKRKNSWTTSIESSQQPEHPPSTATTSPSPHPPSTPPWATSCCLPATTAEQERNCASTTATSAPLSANTDITPDIAHEPDERVSPRTESTVPAAAVRLVLTLRATLCKESNRSRSPLPVGATASSHPARTRKLGSLTTGECTDPR